MKYTKIKVLPVRSENKDTITGLSGVITHIQYDMDGHVKYLFQPRGLDLETGLPVERMFMDEARFEIKKGKVDIEIPAGVLGTDVTDIASGFTGVATDFIMHPNGCFHVSVKPRGLLAKTNATIKAQDFDIRMLRGDALGEPMTEPELQASEKKNPSPAGCVGFETRSR